MKTPIRTTLGLALLSAGFFSVSHAQTNLKGAPMKEKIKAAQKYLRENNLDGWLLYDFRRSNPMAAEFMAIHGQQTRRWFYFIPKEGEPQGLYHRIEYHNFDGVPGKRELFSAWKELEAKLGKMLSGTKKVAMEYSPRNAIPYVSRVDAGTIELVRSFGVEVVSSADLIQTFQAVLTPAEYETHLYAAKALNEIKDKAFARIAEKIKSDQPTDEYEVQQFIWNEYAKYGMTADSPPIVAVNANAANPHYLPTAEASSSIKKGDLVLIDMWAKKDSAGAIYGDMTWMGYVGDKLPEDIAKIWTVLVEARDKAIGYMNLMFANGRKVYGYEVDDCVRGVIEKAGYGPNFTHRTGHSIGVEVHGNGVNIDNFETQDRRELVPGVCFSIEPGIYFEGKYGFRSEIDVFIGYHPAHKVASDAFVGAGPHVEVTTQPVQKEILLLLK
ncbi:MAG: Xaa-Pro peptidase family protein [candidate division Zixibacteria bacterium]|nr:Xaa-Pro peptidase family protein [candidate division Zixibacteria bacterium]